eukprot:4930449-Pyramimonas_sp.AAC.1
MQRWVRLEIAGRGPLETQTSKRTRVQGPCLLPGLLGIRIHIAQPEQRRVARPPAREALSIGQAVFKSGAVRQMAKKNRLKRNLFTIRRSVKKVHANRPIPALHVLQSCPCMLVN